MLKTILPFITTLSLFLQTTLSLEASLHELVDPVPVDFSCRFALKYSCEDFQHREKRNSYLRNVMHWEGKFAQAGIAYDAKSGYTYDGYPLDYSTGELYGSEPHLFSAPSKESIHMAIVALALEENELAMEFIGGPQKLKELLLLKINGYEQFNATYPGFGCFTPWVGFNAEQGTFDPLPSWSEPYYKVPGLDNGEWFWSIYAIAQVLKEGSKVFERQDSDIQKLATRYQAFADCQRNSAKDIFYRGNGDVSATVYILDAKKAPTPENYIHCDGYLNDPYEGETLTQMLYLFSSWESEEERDLLWQKKRGLFEKVDYVIPSKAIASLPKTIQESIGTRNTLTVQRGWWFSTHEQWKTLLLPYLTNDLPVVKKIFRNAEKSRVWDAYANHLPGLLASINDVTDGSEVIPDYSSACGVQELSFEKVERRDIVTPYGSFGLFLHDLPTGLCWYNNMLSGPRMQSGYGSTEAINVNATEISPLTTWDSKITTVLAMLQGIGHITQRGLVQEKDALYKTSYQRFVYILNREHELVFGKAQDVQGDGIPFVQPQAVLDHKSLSDWNLACAKN